MFLEKLQKQIKLSVRVLALGFAFVLSAFNPNTDGNEYQIKAMFIYNFTKYVEWPATDASTVFKIGVIGKSEIMNPLITIASQKKAGDKKIEIDKISIDDDQYCQIIFVSHSQLKILDSIEKKYANKGVLIVTDESEKSSAINLVTRDNKIRFEINQTLARNGGVKISSQLLALAIEVHP